MQPNAQLLGLGPGFFFAATQEQRSVGHTVTQLRTGLQILQVQLRPRLPRIDVGRKLNKWIAASGLDAFFRHRRFPHSSSSSRVTAGGAGFLTLRQWPVRPAR